MYCPSKCLILCFLFCSRDYCRDLNSQPFDHESGALLSLSLIYPLTARVVGALQMISQPISSIFRCSPLPSGTWRTPGLHSLMLSSHLFLCLVFFPLSMYLARWFWQDLMNGRHDHITAVCLSLRVVRLPAGFWHGLPRW